MSKKTKIIVFGLAFFALVIINVLLYMIIDLKSSPAAVATSAQPVAIETKTCTWCDDSKSTWAQSIPEVQRTEKPWYEKLKKPDIGRGVLWLLGFLFNMVAWAWVLNLVALLCRLFHWDAGAEFFDTPWESLKAIVDNDPTSIPARNWPIWTGILAIVAALSLWIGNPIWKVLVTLFWLIIPWILLFGILKIISLTRIVFFWMGVPWDVMVNILRPLFTAASEIGKVHIQKQTKRLAPEDKDAKPTPQDRIDNGRAEAHEMAVKAIREAIEDGSTPPVWALKIVSPSGSSSKNKKKNP